MQVKKLLMAAMLSVVAVTSPLSLTASAEDGLRSVFIAPPSFDDTSDEVEITSDLEFFVARDYLLPSWKTFHQLHERVRIEVVNPDYEERMGQVAPYDATFEIDFIEITGGASPDLFVMSRLPGDCLPQGCLYQVYRLAYDKWVKIHEGHSRSLVYKVEGEGEPKLVQIGDEDSPSVMRRWTGYGFSED